MLKVQKSHPITPKNLTKLNNPDNYRKAFWRERRKVQRLQGALLQLRILIDYKPVYEALIQTIDEALHDVEPRD
jgi:hypothetical protein